MDCDADSSLSDPPDSSDDESDTDSGCTSLPALFYNCNFMGVSQTMNNLNEDTQVANPTYTFISICQNIRNYLNNAPSTANSGTDWMQLTYKLDKGNANRAAACGNGNKGDMKSMCASTKSSMWPTAVYNVATMKNNQKAYQAMSGYTDFISCDEFPPNA